LKFRILSFFLSVFILLSAFPTYAVANTRSTAEHIFTNAELAGTVSVDTSDMFMTSDGFVQINQIENKTLRESGTYYIAEMNDGYLLTSPTSGSFSTTRYFAGNINSHKLQKWIFTEVSTGVYVVYSNTDTSKCLTINPSTRQVTLSAYSGSQYQKWGMYFSNNGNALQSEATDSAVSGYKLVFNGTSCSVSNTSYTPVGFIDVSWFVPCNSITGRDMMVAVNSSSYMYEPTFYPDNSTCNGENWLICVSGNSSVCTIDTLGRVNGLTLGSTVVTILHKITRVTGSFIVQVVNPVIYNARIYYDYGSILSASSLAYIYNSAVEDFYNTYCIDFSLIATSRSSQLDGASCPNTNDNNICTSSCGSYSTCRTTHHKGAWGFLDILGSDSYYTYRLVNHALCYYQNSTGEHKSVVGLGDCPGKNSISSILISPDIECSIQHELTHNLGCSHNTCVESQMCVLKGDIGYWCDACRSIIMTVRD